jgi:hypothetical protein
MVEEEGDSSVYVDTTLQNCIFLPLTMIVYDSVFIVVGVIGGVCCLALIGVGAFFAMYSLVVCLFVCLSKR